MERATPSATAGDAAALPLASERTATHCVPSADASSDCTAGAPVRVVYEDEVLLAVDKPAGLVTHPAYKHPDGTLCDAIFARQAALGAGRPWLLHRLDRETSGLVLFAKTEVARRAVVRQFERRTVCKRYLALLTGLPDPPEGTIAAPLARDPADRRRVVVDPAGQPSATRYHVLAAAGSYALALAEPLTGRTHQIRAHLTAMGAPLVGDRLYLPASSPSLASAGRAMLHAWQLTIQYPSTGQPFTLAAPPPADFLAAAACLGLDAPLAALVMNTDT